MENFDDLDYYDSNNKNDDEKKRISKLEEETLSNLDAENLEELVNLYFDKADFEKALNYVNVLLDLYPYSTDA